MIRIVSDYDCCGCGACKQICPHSAIELVPNSQGFLFPQVNIDICINCSLCERVCPVLNPNQENRPLKVYAAINTNDDIRMQNSSGGIFTSLAEKIIDEGGVVFGARFNENWEVVHDYAETKDGLAPFRGSKYVQSDINSSYIKAEQFLKRGRKVLFSGTPCQIAALNLFLRKPYDGLTTVDVVCHGVPSPGLWKDYLYKFAPVSEITNIKMRDKSEGWRSNRITIEGKNKTLSEMAADNKYLLAFSQNLSLRSSCFKCPAKKGKSGSDITLADYWGIENLIPHMDDNRGTSFICANTNKGVELISELAVNRVASDYEASVPYNISIEQSTKEPVSRSSFWQKYSEKGIGVLSELKPYKTNIMKRFIRVIIRIFK